MLIRIWTLVQPNKVLENGGACGWLSLSSSFDQIISATFPVLFGADTGKEGRWLLENKKFAK